MADKLVIGEEQTLLRTKVGTIATATVHNRRTGRQDTFYRLILPDWVNVVALTADERIVLIRQFRFGSRRIEYEIPGGAVEKGEAPLAAGVRELLEETGYAGKNARIIGEVLPNPAIQNNRCFTVLVEDVERVAEQAMDEMEDIEIILVPYSRLDELVRSGAISHGLVLNALMFHDRLPK